MKKLSRLGPNQQKILLLLFGGLALSLVRSPQGYFHVLGEVAREWQKINRQSLGRAISALYRSRLVKEKINADGSVTTVLTKDGVHKALTFQIDNMVIKRPMRWDGKWRMVLFDIPDRRKKGREALRSILKRLGFHQYQKSIFVCPYPCDDEIDYIIETFYLRPYVRTALVVSFDNEPHIKKIFKL